MGKVIVEFLSKEEKKGNILFFNINKTNFSLQVENEERKPEFQTFRIDSVKKILFLKKEEEKEPHLQTETIEQSMFASTVAFKLIVEFKDGEVINGSTMKYNPDDKGFFVIPLNPADMSERIYVNAQAVKSVDCKRLTGNILVDQNKITSKQLGEALNLQREKKKEKIGTILLNKEIINEKQLNISLQEQRKRNKLLGEILLEAGYITSKQLQYALKIQKKNRKKRLGQILVELKYVTPNDICIALASQLHYPWIDLSRVKVPKEIATLLPEKVVRKFEVIPVKRKGEDLIVVATSQPQDPDLKSKIIKYSPFKVEFVIAYEVYINSAINKDFRKKKI